MADRIDGYADALLSVAKAEGNLDEVEDELFRFGQNLAAPTSSATPSPTRWCRWSGARPSSRTCSAARPRPSRPSSWASSSAPGRGQDLPAIITKLVERAAAEKDRTVAEVRSAVPLTDDQKHRLEAALANATGKQVAVKVIVDPSVLGGLVATVGDQVIDGTVRSRLDQLKAVALGPQGGRTN